MLGNLWFRKLKPLPSFPGFGGGVGGFLNSGAAAPAGLAGSGGTIDDWNDGSTYYRNHIFTSSGSFVVSAVSTDPTCPNAVDFFVIGGGGGGGAGGGGAAGVSLSFPPYGGGTPGNDSPESAVTVSKTTYPVTIGGGGSGGGYATLGTTGTDSTFDGPDITAITSEGGGGGGASNGPPTPGLPGGSGGGGGAFMGGTNFLG